MVTVTFLTLFLGLTTGVQPVTVAVDGPVARVELLLDGTVCDARESPPWRFRCDFGEELAPHRLEARALDAEGRELAADHQQVNLAPRQSSLEMTLERDAEGTPRSLLLAWRSVAFDKPASVRVRLDGEPLAADDPSRFPLPEEMVEGDPHQLHVATAEATFPDGSIARTELTFGGFFGEAVATPNTAVALLPEEGRRLREPADAAGLLVHSGQGGEGAEPAPLRPVALESGAADLVAVVEGSALPELAALRGRFFGLDGRGGRTGMERGDRFFLVDPVPRRGSSPRGGAGGYELFATSPPRQVEEGGLAWQLAHVAFPRGVPQRLADAVAMAAMQAVAGGRPRTVLLVLGPEARDESRQTVAGVRRFLERLRVPLAVWWVERDPRHLPADVRDAVLERWPERRRRQVELAAAWGGLVEVRNFRDLLKASRELRGAVDRQQVLWVEGFHLPTEVALARPGGFRLLGEDAVRGERVQSAESLAARAEETLAGLASEDPSPDGAEFLADAGDPAPAEGSRPGETAVAGLPEPPALQPGGGTGMVWTVSPSGPLLLSEGDLVAFSESLRVDLVEVDVVVTDRQGRPVSDLDRDDFEVYEDGRRVDITHFARTGPEVPASTAATGRGHDHREAARAGQEGSPAPFHLAIYLDDANMGPEQRNRMLERLPALLDHLPPQARIQVVVRDGGLKVGQPFTTDREATLRMLETAARGSGGGHQVDRERYLAIRQVLAREGIDDALRAADLYASQRMGEVRRAVSDLTALVDSLAPLPGRKAVLYVGAELPQVPGREAFRAVQEAYGTATYGRTGHPALRAAQWDASPLYAELARRANGARVTFYGLDAGGLRLPEGTVEQREHTPLASLDPEIAENALRPLQILAHETGGFAITGSNRIAPELARLAEDFSSGYVLGYAAPPMEARGEAREGPEALRNLEVRVKRPGLRIRHREGYVPRTPDRRMEEAVLAALTLPPPPSPFTPQLAFGEAVPMADTSLRLPVLVKVPMAELVLVRRGSLYTTRLELFVVVEDEEGQRSPVRRAEIGIELPEDQAELARGFYTLNLPLRFDAGEHRVAVGVRDQQTGAEAVAVGSVDVTRSDAPLQLFLARRLGHELPVAGVHMLDRQLVGGGWFEAPPSPNPFDRHPFAPGELPPGQVRHWD